MTNNNVGFHNDESDLEGKVDAGANPMVRRQQLFYSSMEVLGALFFCNINNFMGSLFNTLMTFTLEKPVVNREFANKMYGTAAYFLVK